MNKFLKISEVTCTRIFETLENLNSVRAISILLFACFAVEAWYLNTSRFSPDSWSYFELSNTVFSDNFYKFNTYRSYFSDTYSASFPFGFPILLSVLRLFGISNPLGAVYCNIFVAIITLYFIYRIFEEKDIPVIYSMLIAFSLLLNRFYLDEVFAGRSIPFAILLVTIAYLCVLRGQYIVAGLFLGFSVLVRFDFLVYALLMQIAMMHFIKYEVRHSIHVFIGFCLGLMPWMFYSYQKFGTLWISDNSWVAVSAKQAYVLDYPAAPVETIFSSPTNWLLKISKNAIPVIRSFIQGVFFYPTILILAIPFFKLKTGMGKSVKIAIAVYLLLAMSSYFATGYQDKRYFLIILFIASLILTQHILVSCMGQISKIKLQVAVTVSLVLTMMLGVGSLIGFGIDAHQNVGNLKWESEFIHNLSRCHKSHPEQTYVFIDKAFGVATKYGALSGAKSAFAPTNFDSMSLHEKEQFFKTVTPYKLINDMEMPFECSKGSDAS